MENIGQIKSKISSIRKYLIAKYHLKNIAIFGSFARNEQNENSDIDIMVEFSKPVGIEFIDLANELERSLQRRVDLVSKNGIKEKYYRIIKNELNYV
jgi:predicted nucleotidyltransferase